jgi:hypothetical protein
MRPPGYVVRGDWITVIATPPIYPIGSQRPYRQTLAFRGPNAVFRIMTP